MKRITRCLGGAIVLLVLSALFAATGCGSSVGQPSQDGVVGSVEQAVYWTTTCTTDAQCTGGTPPVCGDATTGICSGGLCYYSIHYGTGGLDGNPNCPCVDGDVQSCKAPGSTTYNGVQMCSVVNPMSNPLYTLWSACLTTFTGHTPLTSGPNGTGWGIRNCAGSIDCDNALDRPVCADWDKDICQQQPYSPKECVFSLIKEHGCSCIQYDIRGCTKAGGGSGHQMCVVTGSDPSNDWLEATGWGTCS
jgi:hypothetical protein